MAPLHKVKVLEECRISPPPGSAARPSLPLTFFDLVFFRFHPVQRLLFYESPHSKSRFLHSELPKLKRSLALTLHHFYPLAGSLTRLCGGQKPEILCSDDDFVRLNVAVSGGDFYELSGSHARDVRRFHSLVPSLHSSGDRQAVLAIQATIFPNAGVVVGDAAPCRRRWLHVCQFHEDMGIDTQIWRSSSRVGRTAPILRSQRDRRFQRSQRNLPHRSPITRRRPKCEPLHVPPAVEPPAVETAQRPPAVATAQRPPKRPPKRPNGRCNGFQPSTRPI